MQLYNSKVQMYNSKYVLYPFPLLTCPIVFVILLIVRSKFFESRNRPQDVTLKAREFFGLWYAIAEIRE